MSTARALLLAGLVAACGGKKETRPCLPAVNADSGPATGVVDGVKATACWGGICLELDREGKVIGSADLPTAVAPTQTQQDRQVGNKAWARRDPHAQWTLEDVATGAKTLIGGPGMTLEFFEPSWVVTYRDNKLHLVDAVKEKELADFTLTGKIAAIVPWFERLLLILDKPAGTAQLDPASATLYQGPELPRCQ